MNKVFTLFAVIFIAGSAAFAQPVNNECSGAIDINTLFGQTIGIEQSAGPYDNTTATSVNDPLTGWECYGEPDGTGTAPSLENTLWFTFTGDGNIYFIETGVCAGLTNEIDDGDTQMSIYTGSCGSLVAVACNEDGPSATATYYPAGLTLSTVAGNTYYVMIDGFNFNGTLSEGEYCILVTQLTTIQCNDATVTPGTVSANHTDLCHNDTLIVSTSGVVAPNVGMYNGISWIISSDDITGSTDPLNDPSTIATYTFNGSPQSTAQIAFINDATSTFITQGSSYYWTPVVFGNATEANPNPAFLSDLLLDPACTFVGQSVLVNVLMQGDPLCSGIGINEASASAFAFTSVTPVPAKDEVTLNLSSVISTSATLTVTDYLGRIIETKNVLITSGANTVTVNISSFESGIYFFNFKSEAGNAVTRIIKTN